MNKIIIFLIPIFLFFLQGNGLTNSQYAHSGKISVNKLIDDFDYLKGKLEQYHAGLYRFTPKEELDQVFRSVKSKLSKPLSRRKFLLTLMPAITNINCGHTSLSFPPFEIQVQNESPVLFPFSIKIFESKVYLIDTYNKNIHIPKGSELLGINKLPIEAIMKNIIRNIPSDGYIESFKYFKFEKDFAMNYNMIFGPSQTYDLVYQKPGGNEIKRVTVDGVTDSQRSMFNSNKVFKEAEKPKYEIEFDNESNTAILTIKTFYLPEEHHRKAFPAFLKNSFNEIEKRKIKNLILDLRYNRGGFDIFGKQLVAYFLDEPFFYYKSTRKKIGINRYINSTHPNKGIQQPSKPVYSAKLYVLINGGTYSTTGECVSIFYHYNRATFIGEESGAAYIGGNCGFRRHLLLPNSQLELVVPAIEYTMVVDDKNGHRGVIPQHQIKGSINTYLNGSDAIMEYALDLINNDKSRKLENTSHDL